MPHVRALLLSLLGFALAPAAVALDPGKQFHHYVKSEWSIEQGLPQISVNSISQDGQGYVWAATQSGVARFDGVRFTSYNPDNTPQLPGMLAQSLFTDRDGRLWIGTYKGIAAHDANGFTAIAADVARHPGGLDVRDIRQMRDGRIVFATPNGVFVVHGEAAEPLVGAPVVSAVSLLPDGDTLWIGTEGGAYRVDARGAQLLRVLEQGQPATVTRMLRTQGALWAGTNRGLYQLVDDAWQRYDATADVALPIDAMHEDRDGNLWIAATDSLLRIRDGRVVERVADGSGVALRAVRAIFEDREGNLWLGSQWEGLARIWNGWTRRHSVEEGLHNPIVWSLARDPDGSLWVGGNDGLSRYVDGRFERVLGGAQLPHPSAYTLLPEDEALWIGTRRGLARWRDGALATPPRFATLGNTQINGLLRGADGALWIATMTGLYRDDGVALRRYAEAEGLDDPRVRFLHRGEDGVLLLGTQDGLFALRGERLHRVGESEGLPPHLDVTTLHALGDGELLLGTLAEQVWHWDGRRWFAFGSAQGLPVNSPFFLTHDSQGWLWVAGIRGVYRVPLAELRAVRSGARATVRHAQMLLSERGDIRGSQKGYCCNGAGNAKGFIEDDTLWLPSRGGVVTMHSADVVPNPLPPPVVIERVRHSRKWHDVGPRGAVDLPAGARDLAFEFTALSFQQPSSVGLRYRLLGYDREWQALADATRRDAVYTNLPPGDYTFEVEGANNALVWNPRPARLHFGIGPHFHESAWFYLLLALGLTGVGVALHRLQTAKLRRQQLALERQVEERTQALATANAQLQEASHTDALTGLRNRRFLHGQLPADLSFYLREVRKPGNEGMVMMLALVDIDHFKAINDRHGHHAGDLVLQQFARVLEQQVRSGDYVVRWGGEEFLLVFRPMPQKEAVKIAERVRRAIAGHRFAIEGGELTLTGSLGFIEFPLFRDGSGAPDWQRMIEAADRALYAVKESGRNGWATYRPTATMDLETLVEELRDAHAALAAGRVVLERSPPVPTHDARHGTEEPGP